MKAVNRSEHMMFSVEDAEKYGTDEAIMLQNIKFWCRKNAANRKHIHADSDGKMRSWTYNSGKAFSRLFPFWSERQIRTILTKLKNAGAIDSANHNKVAYDRTLWYCVLGDEFIVDASEKDDESILQNGQMEETEQSNRKDRNVSPIPDVNTDVTTDINREEEKSAPDGATRPRNPFDLERGSENEYRNLFDSYGEDKTRDYHDRILDYEKSKWGKRHYKNMPATIRNWIRKDEQSEKSKSGPKKISVAEYFERERMEGAS